MRITLNRRRTGTIMINTLVIVFFLMMTGTAFMMWAVDENQEAEIDLARTQAYYVAQQGVLARALKEMRTLQAEALPSGEVGLPPGDMISRQNEYVGRYTDVKLSRLENFYGSGDSTQNIWNTKFFFDMTATGHVPVQYSDGQGLVVRDIQRTVTMRARLRTFASYMYLTNYEQTMFGEIIWFWTPDTLYGRVHSNSSIGIKYSPGFYGPVSTTEDEFIEFAASPWFAYPPQFDAPKVYFPETAVNLRAGASGGGTFFSDNNGQWQSRLVGEIGGWHLYQWDNAVPFDSLHIANELVIPYTGSLAIFVEGNVQVWGDYISGGCTIGSSGNMELWDNVKIAEVNVNNPDVSQAQSIVGLVSERNIRIKDTYVNGRGNGLIAPGGHERKHIVITAAMVALGESFTFEHQNDAWNTYLWCDPAGDHAGESDERGTIWLRGAVTQMRRGYVHRSNCGGTGYAKDYLYDFRLERTPPPYYLEAVDENGSSLFDIVYWKELSPDMDQNQRGY